MLHDDLLQFKDYSVSPSTSSPPPAQINVNSPNHFPTSSSRAPLDFVYDMTNDAFGGGDMNAKGDAGLPSESSENVTATEDSNKLSFLTMEYYQQFFNVDTFVVIERIANSMVPKRVGGNYLRTNIGKNPDLYGPFWITVTLIFSIAISGNVSSYLQHGNETFRWHYKFHLVSYAATCIFLYANIVPGALWALFKYSLKPIEEDLETESANYTPTLLSLMCIYGYSLAIYIPVSILWVIQISLLQWLLVITAALLSGSVLIVVLTPALRNSKISLFLIIGILGAHFLLAAGFMLFFFHVPSTDANAPIAATTAAEVVTKKALNMVKHAVETAVTAAPKNVTV